ncbi:MAG TPA: ABC transporter permease, partial [Candidatus Acidoferrales bacterium]|nr:ABC transporter permease [Candidatus Acidoferrales bacterium]
MSWLRQMFIRLRELFGNRQHDARLAAELQTHLSLLIEQNISRGMSPDDARRAAKISLGGGDQIKQSVHDHRGLPFLETLWQDVRFALRMLRKSPGFTAIAVLTLALGIGANTSIFSVIEGVLLKPLPYPHPEQLVTINLSPLALDPLVHNMAPEDYFVFRDQSRSFQNIGLYVGSPANITGIGEPEHVRALYVTSDTLTALGVPAMRGRLFSPADDTPNAPLTAVLTYGYWQRKFGGDPAAIGKTIIVDGNPQRIIGVLPQSFRFLDQQNLALIMPLQLNRSKTLIGNFFYFGLARLSDNTTIAQATADAARLIPVALRSFPTQPGYPLDIFFKARLTPQIVPLKDEVVGNVGAFLWVLMGGIGMVLLIACANVANLMLVRTEGRRQELAIRAALGAGRRRIAAQLLRESLLIGILGGILGLGLAWAGLRLLIAIAPAGLPRLSDIAINLPVLAFAFAIALFTGLLFGLFPVLKYAGSRSALSDTSRTVGASRQRHRARSVLVAVQVALALVLLICSGLMIRTFRVLTHVNPGFTQPAELQTFHLSIPNSDVADDTLVPRFEQQILAKLSAIPGVSSAAVASSVPLDGNTNVNNIFAEDHTYAQGKLPPFRHLVFVSPGYLQTMGTPIIAGRDFTWTDTYNELPVALISENFAREYWGSPTNALGKRIRISKVDDWRQIIGVVSDVRDQGMDHPARPVVYWPVIVKNFQSQPLQVIRAATFVVRSPLAGTPALMNQIRQAVWSVDAKLPLAGVSTMGDLYRSSMARTSFTLVMLAIAGGMALLLGAIGLSGVIAYSVSQRTREIGIRVALGAQRRDLLRLVLREGMLVILLGLVAGLAGSFALTRFLSGLLYG